MGRAFPANGLLPIVASVLVSSFAGCGNAPVATDSGGAADAPVRDPIAAFCARLVDSPDGCSTACFDAGRAASAGPCSDETAALQASPEVPAYLDCVGTCPTARTCPAGETMRDCDCGAACVRAMSDGFQALVEAVASCTDAELSGTCY